MPYSTRLGSGGGGGEGYIACSNNKIGDGKYYINPSFRNSSTSYTYKDLPTSGYRNESSRYTARSSGYDEPSIVNHRQATNNKNNNNMSACSPGQRLDAKLAELIHSGDVQLRQRCESGSSGSSVKSTDTVCGDNEKQVAGATSRCQRSQRSTEPPLRIVTPCAAQTTIRELYGESSKTTIDEGQQQNMPKEHADDKLVVKHPATDSEATISATKEDRHSTKTWSNLAARPAAASADLVASTAEGDKRKASNSDLRRKYSRENRPTAHMGTSTRRSGTDMIAQSAVDIGGATETEDDSQSVSTVSGSGIDFFRKFVQRKGSGCKDCEDQFRREVLIDRLVSDSLTTKAALSERGSSKMSSENETCRLQSRNTTLSRLTGGTTPSGQILSSLSERSVETRCRNHRAPSTTSTTSSLSVEEVQSQSSSTLSSASLSNISGSGLLFLKNYLKKKKSNKSRTGSTAAAVGGSNGLPPLANPSNINFFNSTPMPFPPPADHYGPVFVEHSNEDQDDSSYLSANRRLSLCSTVADLLNEDFDCDDSELQILDWEEWDEPLPQDLNYDDLVSVISESFYSDDLDLSELCDLDWEGRKTVVATEKERQNQGADDQWLGGKLSPDVDCPEDKLAGGDDDEEEDVKGQQDEVDVDGERVGSVKYSSSYKSSTFLQDLEAELELPPMTPVSDEKEEAVRAISRTISKYMRTRSDGSYDGLAGSCSERSYGLSSSNSNYEEPGYSSRNNSHPANYDDLGRSSRTNIYIKNNKTKSDDHGRVSRNSIHNPGYPNRSTTTNNSNDIGRDSRLSVASPALSEYLPELASTPVSPILYRRPLSQLLIYESPSSPCSQLPDVTVLGGDESNMGIHYPGGTTAPTAPGRGAGGSMPRSPVLTPQQISDMLSLPKSEFTLNLDGRGGRSPDFKSDLRLSEMGGYDQLRARTGDHISGSNNGATKNANRDSLLCNNYAYTPPQCASPLTIGGGGGVGGGGAGASINVPHRPPFLRHSSSNSTDSGCPLLEDKIASLSPTPSPRTNIELLSSNRTKLASFWEKSLTNGLPDMPANNSTSSVWIAGGACPSTPRLGFQPVRPTFGSDSSLGHGSNDRLAHFLDVTRRAAERKTTGRGFLNRASTGSDCSEILGKTPLSPGQTRRRDSFTEYFV